MLWTRHHYYKEIYLLQRDISMASEVDIDRSLSNCHCKMYTPFQLLMNKGSCLQQFRDGHCSWIYCLDSVVKVHDCVAWNFAHNSNAAQELLQVHIVITTAILL